MPPVPLSPEGETSALRGDLHGKIEYGAPHLEPLQEAFISHEEENLKSEVNIDDVWRRHRRCMPPTSSMFGDPDFPTPSPRIFKRW